MIAVTSGIVPIALLAPVTATHRVRSVSSAVTFSTGRRPLCDVEVGEPHDGARVFSDEHPGRDVGVVVEAGTDDLVAGPQVVADRARDREHVGGRGRAEHEAVGIGVQQPSHRLLGAGDELVAGVGGREGSVAVGVVAAALPGGGGLDRRVDHLGAGRAVEPGPSLRGRPR